MVWMSAVAALVANSLLVDAEVIVDPPGVADVRLLCRVMFKIPMLV
jgi:hypothetical protein